MAIARFPTENIRLYLEMWAGSDESKCESLVGPNGDLLATP